MYLYGLIDFSLILILLSLIIILSYQKDGKNIYRIVAFILEILLFCMIQGGGFNGYASLWALAFPLFSFFLMGKKEGFFWTSICFIFTIILFTNPFSFFTVFHYSNEFVLRHLFIFFLIFSFTYNYESVREKYKLAMETEQEKLLLEKLKLAEAKEETDKANHLLETEMKVREQTEVELRRHRDHLEDIVAERTLEITKNGLEKERLQEQLAQSQKLEALGTLVGGLAHDFNNFLTGITGSFEILSHLFKEESLNHNDVEKYLKLGIESSKRSAGLIKQLLILSKKHEIELSPLDIKNSINHVYELCRNSFPKSIELKFQTEDAPLVIMGDMVQIEQVLLNLCINACHAMTIMRKPGIKHGGILSVTTENVPSDYILKENYPEETGMTDHWIRIQISDTGVGFDNDTRQRIFEPFFSTKNKSDGTGLGLATSYNIIKKHGGIVNIYSEPGSGSCFSIYFPVYNNSYTNLRGEIDREIIYGTGTVLVIDDELSILKIAEGFLKLCGYRVITAEGADRGIEIFFNEHRMISAVLIDLSMPGKSGLEVYRELAKIDSGVKAILSSGMLDNETKELALKTGIKDTVNKPYMASELSIKLRKVINGN